MTHAFVPQHLIELAEYLKTKEFSDENYDLQCINRTIINRAYLSTYLHTQEWVINNGPHNDIKDSCENDVGYHTAIGIALNKLNELKAILTCAYFLGRIFAGETIQLL